MRFRLAIAVVAAALAAPATNARSAYPAELASRFAWSLEDPAFGGWSGIEMSPNGRTFVAISDRGNILSGILERDGDGQIVNVKTGRIQPIPHSDGNNRLPRYYTDSEGLALGNNGRLFISFEGRHRIAAYPDSRALKATDLAKGDFFTDLRLNSSLEALAIGPDGALYTLPENPGGNRPFPVYRFADGTWRSFGTIARHDKFLPVGADIGPDGRFYLLERKFAGIFGFASRVRRFDMTPGGLDGETVLLRSPAGIHDNLEGLAVWSDAAGRIRLTMVSDDNFHAYQKSEIVEYVVTR